MNIRRRPERGSVWRIAPPLTVARDDIDLAMTMFDQALTEMKDVLVKRGAPKGARSLQSPPLAARRAAM
jgi:hypothetical protein